MIRRVNFTNRKRLDKSCASIRMFVFGDSAPTEFQAELNFDDQGLPADARVYVEAYYRSSLMRFPFGTVAGCSSYASSRFKLTEILNSIAFFRVKVVDEAEEIGRIIASIDRIKATTPGQQAAKELSLMYVQYTDLGDRVWKLDVDEGHAMPVLQINNNLSVDGSLAQILTSDPMFFSLVYPATVRSIFEFLLITSDLDIEDPHGWPRQWLKFAFSMLGERKLPLGNAGLDEKWEWIDNVVQAFCANQGVKAKFEQALQERN